MSETAHCDDYYIFTCQSSWQIQTTLIQSDVTNNMHDQEKETNEKVQITVLLSLHTSLHFSCWAPRQPVTVPLFIPHSQDNLLSCFNVRQLNSEKNVEMLYISRPQNADFEVRALFLTHVKGFARLLKLNSDVTSQWAHFNSQVLMKLKTPETVFSYPQKLSCCQWKQRLTHDEPQQVFLVPNYFHYDEGHLTMMPNAQMSWFCSFLHVQYS